MMYILTPVSSCPSVLACCPTRLSARAVPANKHVCPVVPIRSSNIRGVCTAGVDFVGLTGALWELASPLYVLEQGIALVQQLRLPDQASPF